MTAISAPFRLTRFPSSAMRVERPADGSWIVTPVVPLQDFSPNLPAELVKWARQLPEKTYLAQRSEAGGPWIRHSYESTRRDAHAVAQWLLDRDIEPGRSVLILSGNSIAHAVIKYGAMTARVAYCQSAPTTH